MGFKDLQESIMEEAKAKAKEINKEAEAEAERIVKEAEAKAKEIDESAKARAKEEYERIIREFEIGAELEKEGKVLEAKGQVLAAAMPHVTKKVLQQLEKKYAKDLLESAVAEIKKAAGGKPLRIYASKELADIAKKHASSVERLDGEGAIVETEDKSVRIDATPKRLVQDNIDMIKGAVSAALFGGEEKARTSKRTSKAKGAAGGARGKKKASAGRRSARKNRRGK